jgi:predicted HTH domain antitoxin
VAATKTAKSRTSRNDTPNTPEVSESKIARMKVAELRKELNDRGVKGTDGLKKPELVNKLIKAELKSAKNTKTANRSARSSRNNPTSRNDTPNTPEVSESKIARMKVAELRKELNDRGVKGTDGLKKPELVKKLVKTLTGKSARSSARTRTAGTTGSKRTARTTGNKRTAKATKTSDRERTGRTTSQSRRPSPELTSPAPRPQPADRTPLAAQPQQADRTPLAAQPQQADRTSAVAQPQQADRTLVTTDHEVIRRWAKSRRAIPAHVAGTQHDGGLGDLRFDLPSNPDDRLVEVSWAEWFDAFDKRGLNFLYHQFRPGSERSVFFELEMPDEEA